MIEFSEMRGPNKIFGSFCEINEPNILFGPLISENSIVKPPLILCYLPITLGISTTACFCRNLSLWKAQRCLLEISRGRRISCRTS